MILHTERLKLRELSWNDLEAVHELHCLPETDQFNTLGIPDSIETTKNIVSEWLNAQNGPVVTKYVFCIENTGNGFIGLIGLTIGKPKYKNAEIWYKLHPRYWNQGYATEIVKRILFFGFDNLKLHRIEAGCAVENLASLRVLEKAGMIREGLRRNVLPIRGQWVDNFEYAILETDFYNWKDG